MLHDEEIEPEKYVLDEFYLSIAIGRWWLLGGLINDEDRCIHFLFVSDNKWLTGIPRLQIKKVANLIKYLDKLINHIPFETDNYMKAKEEWVMCVWSAKSLNT